MGEFRITGSVWKLVADSADAGTAQDQVPLAGVTGRIRSNIPKNTAVPVAGGIEFIPERQIVVMDDGHIGTVAEDGTVTAGVSLFTDPTFTAANPLQWTVILDPFEIAGDTVRPRRWTFNARDDGWSGTLDELAPVISVKAGQITKGDKGDDGLGWQTFTMLVGDGTSGPFTFTNQLGRADVSVQARRVSDGKELRVDNSADASIIIVRPDEIWAPGSVRITVWATTDTVAPSAPTGLAATGVTGTTVPLSWTAATDNIGVTGYRIYRAPGSGASFGSASLIASPTATSYTDTGLANSTSYTYFVTALDASGNESAPSIGLTGTTTSGADTTAPSAPTGLAATGVTGTTVPLSWTAATDNIAVTGYRVYRAAGTGASFGSAALLGTTAGTSYTDTTALPLHGYTYFVTARDAAGNESAASTGANATTLYRAHYDTGLIIDLDPAALALSDGTSVSTITPTAGSEAAHAFTQATLANQPLFNTNIRNGKPALTFDDTNDWLDATWTNQHGPGATTPGPVTVFAVAKFDQNTDNLFTGAATNIGLTLARYSGAPTLRAGSGTGGVITHTYTSSTWGVFVCVFDGTSSKLLINETSGGTTGTVGVSSGSPVSGAYLAGMRIGASNAPGNYLAGQLCRLMAIDGHVSDANIAIEVAALGSEYGITVS